MGHVLYLALLLVVFVCLGAFTGKLIVWLRGGRGLETWQLVVLVVCFVVLFDVVRAVT
jgi:hypothetical protein